MTDDLVNEARLALWSAYCDMKIDLKKSADYIEKLEAALREIATRCDATRLPGCDRNGQWAADTARKALEGKDD